MTGRTTVVRFLMNRDALGHQAGDTIALRWIDRGYGWIDVVHGDGDPDDLNPRTTSAAEIIATARRIDGRRAWVIEGFGGHSDFLPNKTVAAQQLLALLASELGERQAVR